MIEKLSDNELLMRYADRVRCNYYCPTGCATCRGDGFQQHELRNEIDRRMEGASQDDPHKSMSDDDYRLLLKCKHQLEYLNGREEKPTTTALLENLKHRLQLPQ